MNMADITITNNISGSTTTASYTHDESTDLVTIVAQGTIKRNYMFDTACRYTLKSGTSVSVNGDVSDDGLSATFVCPNADVSVTFVLSGDFVKSVRITDNTTNTSNDMAKAYRTTESEIVANFYPLDGYEFNETDFNMLGTYTDVYGGTSKQKLTRSSAQLATYTFKMSAVKATTAITFTGDANEKQGSDINITNDVSGTTNYSYTYNESTNELVITLVGTVSSCYMFDAMCTYTNSDGNAANVDGIVSDDGLTATFTINDGDVSQPFVLQGNFVKAVRIKDQTTYTTNNLQKAYKKTDAQIVAEFYPLDGYEFNETDFNMMALYTDSFGETIKKKMTRSSGELATITLQMTTLSSTITLIFQGSANVKKQAVLNLGSINAYIVDNDTLSQFANKRFFEKTSDYYSYDVDLGVYVNRIKRIYIKCDVGENQVIRCGNYNTQLEAKSLLNRYETIDFGNVTIPFTNGDNVDYQGKVQMMLPFVGMVDVSSDYIGYTLGLQLKVDMVSGGGIWQLSANGNVISMWECSPCTDVLFRTNEDLTLIGGDEWDAQLLYGLRPFVNYTSYESVDVPKNSDVGIKPISKCEGLVMGDLPNIDKISCMSEEKEMIKHLFSQGVIV